MQQAMNSLAGALLGATQMLLAALAPVEVAAVEVAAAEVAAEVAVAEVAVTPRGWTAATAECKSSHQGEHPAFQAEHWQLVSKPVGVVIRLTYWAPQQTNDPNSFCPSLQIPR